MQRAVYRKYLSSRDVTDILAGNRHALEGITILRKICNHPDILKRTIMDTDPDYGAVERSAKLQVTLKVRALRSSSFVAMYSALSLCLCAPEFAATLKSTSVLRASVGTKSGNRPGKPVDLLLQSSCCTVSGY